MKTKCTIPLLTKLAGLAVLASSSSLFAQEEPITIYLKTDKLANTNVSINVDDYWLESDKSTEYVGSFGSNVDGIVDATGIANLYTKVAGAGPNVTFGNLNYNVSAGANNTELLVLGGSKKLTVTNDFVFSFKVEDPYVTGSSSQLNTSYQQIAFWDGAAIEVGGSFVVEAFHTAKNEEDQKELLFSLGNRAWGSATSKMEVAGDLVLSGYNIQFETKIPTLNVGGVVSLNGNVFSFAPSYLGRDTNIKMGGLGNLDGSMGTGVLGNGANTKDNTVNQSITFTNSAKYDFKGTLLFIDEATNFTINMEATDATNGRQILRFETKEDTSKYIGYNGTGGGIAQEVQTLDNLNVKAGRLDLAMHEYMQVRNFSLNGANAVFSTTGLEENSEIGTIAVETMDLTKGKLVFDCSASENDYIRITSEYKTTDNANAGMLLVANPADITFVINSGDDVDSYLESNTMLEVLLISFESTNITVNDLANFNVESTSEYNVTLEGVLSNGELVGINAVFSTVPEPATIASLLGVFALAVAIIRRRK